MPVTAFLCPKFQEDGNGGLEANNSVVSLAGAGRKHARGKILTGCLKASAREIGREMGQERPQ